MDADACRNRTMQACVNCKSRKKKCDKRSPSCSYCIRKGLDCRYGPVPRRHVLLARNAAPPYTAIVRDELPPETIDNLALPNTALGSQTKRTTLYRPIFESLDGIYLEVQNIIRSTGEFVDDLTARYFRNFHGHLPIISRTRFQSSLIARETPPGADSSVLLLAVCLIAYLPSPALLPPGGERSVIGRQALYLATKALLAQVRGSAQPTVPLIQASLLLATYEYANGKPNAALITIASCARMAYVARIHDSRRHDISDGSKLEVEEARNTWWGIVISERAFMCEVGDFEQPMATIFPSDDTRLPVDRDILDRGDFLNADSIPDIPVSCPISTSVGGFGRAAQASGLMDRVFRAFAIPDLNTRLPQLESLDRAIQSFLSLVLARSPDRMLSDCSALAMTSRALFMLHGHILNIPHQVISANFKSLEEWKKTSLAALDTVTTMVVDMVRSHYSSLPSDGTSNISPVHIYVVRASLRHIHTQSYDGDFPWSGGAENDLQVYLDKIQHQWVVSYD